MVNLKRESGLSKRIVEDSFKYGIRHEADLHVLIEHGLQEPVISTKVNCGKNHTAPFQFLSDVILNEVSDFIVWANRSGSKSYLAGLIAWIQSGLYDRCETNILAGSLKQAEKSYKAMNSFWSLSRMEEILDKDPLQSETIWKNGSEVHILTASQKSARGGHPQKLTLDEVDEMDLEIYKAALQQPQSKHGISAGTGIYSTNHRRDGTMDYVLELNKKQGGFKVYKYCIWECLESCRDYSCSTCQLAEFCPGKHMKEANGYYTIEDFVRKLHHNNIDTIRTEWFCDKVGARDLVYGRDFDVDRHVLDIDFNKELDVYLSMDWGGTHPFSFGIWQDFPDLGWARVDEVYEAKTTNQRLLKFCRKEPWFKNIVGAVADPARADLKMEWEDELADKKIEIDGASNAIDDGIEAVKNALNPVLGEPKIHFSKKCMNTIREAGVYKQRNGKPVDADNHTWDEIRYFVKQKIAETKQKEGYAKSPDWSTDPD